MRHCFGPIIPSSLRASGSERCGFKRKEKKEGSPTDEKKVENKRFKTILLLLYYYYYMLAQK
jgi:DNA polymerase elongation subunit (family B)